MSGILVMAPYAGNVSSVLNRAFAAFVSVSDKSQKNLVESIYAIDRTRSIHMMNLSSFFLVANGTTYAKAPTWGGRKGSAVVRILDVQF